MEPADAQSNILLVEDNLADAELLQQFYRTTMHVRSGWILVQDGEEALAFLEQRGRYEGALRPQVIILDIVLPKRSRWEILAAIRARPALSAIPVIILAGFLSPEDQAQCEQLKPTMCFQKPCTLESYEHVVKSIEAL